MVFCGRLFTFRNFLQVDICGPIHRVQYFESKQNGGWRSSTTDLYFYFKTFKSMPQISTARKFVLKTKMVIIAIVSSVETTRKIHDKRPEILREYGKWKKLGLLLPPKQFQSGTCKVTGKSIMVSHATIKLLFLFHQ